MRITHMAIIGAVLMVASPAIAGPGYSQNQENGVQVFRGSHGPTVSPQAVLLQNQIDQRAAQKKQADALKRLNRKMDAQSQAITGLSQNVQNLERKQETSKRRRVYYGNPAFFGRNGFIGNRYYGGATIQLSRRPHYKPKT